MGFGALIIIFTLHFYIRTVFIILLQDSDLKNYFARFDIWNLFLIECYLCALLILYFLSLI